MLSALLGTLTASSAVHTFATGAVFVATVASMKDSL